MKKSPIFIDTRALMTKTHYAKKRKVNLTYVTELIKRGILKVRKIEELDLELIRERSTTGKLIKIDPNKYTLPIVYAKEKGINPQRVYNWISRERIEFLKYPILNNLVLIERGSEKVKLTKLKSNR